MKREIWMFFTKNNGLFSVKKPTKSGLTFWKEVV